MKDDLLERIKARLPGLSKGQRVIGEFICEHYDKAAYMTASNLGKCVSVSESTVVRFAVEMGFEGYTELQQELRKLIRNRLTAYQRMEVTAQRLGEGDLLTNVLNEDIDRIRHTLEIINKDNFYAAVRALEEAENIYILAARTSATLANFLAYNLGLIAENVYRIQNAGGIELFEQLRRLGEGDVAVVISFPRYSKNIIDAAAFARVRGAKIIAITDSISSPAAEAADITLTAQSDMVSFVDSLVAPLSVINAIIVAVSMDRREELKEPFSRLEEIWHNWDFYNQT